jgi:hypothetical protein
LALHKIREGAWRQANQENNGFGPSEVRLTFTNDALTFGVVCLLGSAQASWEQLEAKVERWLQDENFLCSK